MNDFQRRVRAAVYAQFVDCATAPCPAKLASAFEVPVEDVANALLALADQHCLVLHRGTTDVWMAHPFSAIETDCAVRIGDRRWFANCAWDALAILAVLGDGTFDTHCPATTTPLQFTARGGKVSGQGVVHFLVPAREFWNDIGHT